MLYNPPGGHSYWLHQGAIHHNTVRKFHFKQISHFKNTPEYSLGCMVVKAGELKYFIKLQVHKCVLNT